MAKIEELSYQPGHRLEELTAQDELAGDTGASTSRNLSRVLLFVPTFNEEMGLNTVLHQARLLGVPALVVDGGSTDGTREVAQTYGAPFIPSPKGKGRQWRKFCSLIDYSDYDYVAMIDSDATYNLMELPALLAAGGDMVIGKRVPNQNSHSLWRRMGSSSFSSLATWLTSQHCKDLLSGFRIMRTSCLQEVKIESDGFGLESELTMEFLRRRFQVLWVSVSYHRRLGTSKLHAVRDGWDILKTVICSRYRAL